MLDFVGSQKNKNPTHFWRAGLEISLLVGLVEFLLLACGLNEVKPGNAAKRDNTANIISHLVFSCRCSIHQRPGTMRAAVSLVKADTNNGVCWDSQAPIDILS